MRLWLPAMALSVALAMSCDAEAMGVAVAGGANHAGGGFGGHGFGFHGSGFHGSGFHRFGIRHPYRTPRHLFRSPHLNFGAGFVSHRSNVVLGGVGSYDSSSDDDYDSDDDDIGNLHFRVQEPFGPGDIGRRPARPEEDGPYNSGGTYPWRGYEPEG